MRGRNQQPDQTIARSVFCVYGNVDTHYGILHPGGEVHMNIINIICHTSITRLQRIIHCYTFPSGTAWPLKMGSIGCSETL